MSKSKSHGRSAATNVDATSSLVLRPPSPNLAINPYQLTLQSLLTDDGRHWSPDPHPPARAIAGHPAPVRLKGVRGYSLSQVQSLTQTRLGFARPEVTNVCVRRKTRRQVMFALKRRGKGSGAKHRKRNEYSNHRC